MSRKIVRYRSPRARRIVQYARIVLVAAGAATIVSFFSWLGSGMQMFSFNWTMIALTGLLSLIALALLRLAAWAGRDPDTGLADVVVYYRAEVRAWTPHLQAAHYSALRAENAQIQLPVLPTAPVVIPDAVPAAPIRVVPVPAPAVPDLIPAIHPVPEPAAASVIPAELAVQN